MNRGGNNATSNTIHFSGRGGHSMLYIPKHTSTNTTSPNITQSNHNTTSGGNNGQRKLPNTSSNRPYNLKKLVHRDIMSKILFKWPLSKLVEFTRYIIILINQECKEIYHTRTTNPPSDESERNDMDESRNNNFIQMDIINDLIHQDMEESYFSNHTRMKMVRNFRNHRSTFTHILLSQEIRFISNEDYYQEVDVSFRSFYTSYYKDSYQFIKSRGSTDNGECIKSEEILENEETYLLSMLRGCFIIGFIYDERIRRFVMSNHSYHSNIFMTRPPNTEKAKQFVTRCRPIVDSFILGNNPQYRQEVVSTMDSTHDNDDLDDIGVKEEEIHVTKPREILLMNDMVQQSIIIWVEIDINNS